MILDTSAVSAPDTLAQGLLPRPNRCVPAPSCCADAAKTVAGPCAFPAGVALRVSVTVILRSATRLRVTAVPTPAVSAWAARGTPW